MVDLEALFPRLSGAQYQVTSAASEDYNCIAWAVGDSARWWWPDLLQKRYWPSGIAREESLAAFVEVFESLGFVACHDEILEAGYEKIALFADQQVPQHAARQLSTGRWTSKLGELEDIEHALRDLEGTEYGRVALVMKRAINNA